MPTFMTENKKELILSCKCGCDEAMKFVVDLEDADSDIIMFMSFLTSKWYSKQKTLRSRFADKVKRIWKVLRNQDYCYADQVLTKEDFRVFREYINQFDV